MEYRYALEKKKPMAAFLHSDPGTISSKQCEKTDEGKAKLAAFNNLIAKKAYKKWSTPDGLGYAVMQGIARLRKTRPGVGWVRGDQLPSEETTTELLRLRRVVEELEGRLEAAESGPPPGTEGFAQSDDRIPIEFVVTYKNTYASYGAGPAWVFDVERTVNQVLYAIGAHMLDEANEEEIGQGLVTAFGRRVREEFESYAAGNLEEDVKWTKQRGGWGRTRASTRGVHTVVIQLFALGVIAKSSKKRSVKDSSIYWSLTPHGQETVMKLRAVRRPGYEFSDDEESD